jgi:hypothetical protein
LPLVLLLPLPLPLPLQQVLPQVLLPPSGRP